MNADNLLSGPPVMVGDGLPAVGGAYSTMKLDQSEALT